MTFQKNDFIELQFTGKTKEGEIFDSNIVEDLKKIDAEFKNPPKNFIYSLGNGMFLDGIDDFLMGKDLGKYSVELTPEKAFGLRNPGFIQVMPLNLFQKQKLNPIPGVTLNFDGRIGKILTNSGGRVRVDFNHPLAGKIVTYDLNVIRKVEDMNEKVSSFNDFLFKRSFNFKIEENKVILEVEKKMASFVKLFEDKFKEILGLGLEVKEVVEEAKKVIPKEIENYSEENKLQ